MNDILYTVIAIDGNVMDFAFGRDTPYLRYNNLSWEQANEIFQYSFREGYTCVVWQEPDKDDECEADDGEESE